MNWAPPTSLAIIVVSAPACTPTESAPLESFPGLQLLLFESTEAASWARVDESRALRAASTASPLLLRYEETAEFLDVTATMFELQPIYVQQPSHVLPTPDWVAQLESGGWTEIPQPWSLPEIQLRGLDPEPCWREGGCRFSGRCVRPCPLGQPQHPELLLGTAHTCSAPTERSTPGGTCVRVAGCDPSLAESLRSRSDVVFVAPGGVGIGTFENPAPLTEDLLEATTSTIAFLPGEYHLRRANLSALPPLLRGLCPEQTRVTFDSVIARRGALRTDRMEVFAIFEDAFDAEVVATRSVLNLTFERGSFLRSLRLEGSLFRAAGVSAMRLVTVESELSAASNEGATLELSIDRAEVYRSVLRHAHLVAAQARIAGTVVVEGAVWMGPAGNHVVADTLLTKCPQECIRAEGLVGLQNVLLEGETGMRVIGAVAQLDRTEIRGDRVALELEDQPSGEGCEVRGANVVLSASAEDALSVAKVATGCSLVLTRFRMTGRRECARVASVDRLMLADGELRSCSVGVSTETSEGARELWARTSTVALTDVREPVR